MNNCVFCWVGGHSVLLLKAVDIYISPMAFPEWYNLATYRISSIPDGKDAHPMENNSNPFIFRTYNTKGSSSLRRRLLIEKQKG